MASAWSSWKAELWGRNLADKQYFTGTQDAGATFSGQPGAPRTYGSFGSFGGQDVGSGFAAGAASRDRDRRLPHAEISELAASGLLGITVPAVHGGPELPPSVAADVFRVLGAADANIAQIPHSHFVYANLLRVAGSPRSAP